LDHDTDSANDDADNKTEFSKAQLFSEKLNEIKIKCHTSGIEFENKNNDGSVYAKISINAGRTKRSFIIRSLNNAIRFLNIDFENYNFIHGYEAISCYSKGLIEASIRPAGL